MEQGLAHLCEYLLPCEAELQVGPELKVYKLAIEMLSLGLPYQAGENKALVKDSRLLPAETRLKGTTYSAPLIASMSRQLDGSTMDRFKINLGNVPVLVKSKFCHLRHMSVAEQINVGEDELELGGYFIVNGVERLLRYLLVQKCNYPIAMHRPSYANRGKKYTPYGVSIKCVREDLFTQTVTVYYLADGNCTMSFRLRRGEFIIPAIIVLKALAGISEEDVFYRLVDLQHSETHLRAQVLIQDAHKYGIHSEKAALEFIGGKCKRNMVVTSLMTDAQVGALVLREHVFVHLERKLDKLNLLLLMIRKCYSLAEGAICPEGTDALSTQDLLMPGHLYLNVIKEKLEDALESVKQRLVKESAKGLEKLRDITFIQKIIEQHAGIGKKLENFLATGNLASRTGLDLLQDKGFSVIAEKLNYSRFVSHFHSVHRGSYFTEMKITSVRKLLPESWGFLCPVHTPDGAPCGLLNHLASACRPVAKPLELDTSLLASAGMQLLGKNEVCKFSDAPVVVGGKLVGTVKDPAQFTQQLRELKYRRELDKFIEIAYLPGRPLFVGVFLFTGEGRLMRPVATLGSEKRCVEWVGPLDQLNLSIACTERDIQPHSSHIELSPLSMLSLLAISIPFSDHNQSPRNMYQCQMAKQTMGTPFYNYRYRTDNKIYRITTPQAPLVTTKAKQFTQFGFPSYPQGTNAVVAVISYTGYDMEDAMIINKAAYERGLAHGILYKTRTLQVSKDGQKFELLRKHSGRGLDSDGLKRVGDSLEYFTPELAVYEPKPDTVKVFKYKENEAAKLDDAVLIGENDSFSVLYKYRHIRNPVVGDKFSSRHGQKGVLSILWPQEDMPFTAEGITPDIIINPHAFPSRMTIGMLIESMAGKAGALHGTFQDSQPFAHPDKLLEFGDLLAQAGYNYYGSETMYSGIFGTELKAEIYVGIVYYQRLRHMVSDKYQARATGPIDILTKQPVKGRKRGGGIRLGEMERDSLLAHGAAFWLHDRLMSCSDHSEGYLCPQCGSILSCYLQSGKEGSACSLCAVAGVKVAVPYVLRYLTNELAAMNIQLKFNYEK